MRDMRGDTHACPINGCTAGDLPYHILMCSEHWNLVPKALQHAVYENWRRGWATKGYPEVRQAAIDTVHDALDKTFTDK